MQRLAAHVGQIRLATALPDPEMAAATSHHGTLVPGEFFALVAGTETAAALTPPYDCLLLDIDHAPDFVLDSSYESFYSTSGLRRLYPLLTADAVFALWSDRPGHPGFAATLATVFAETRAEEIRFANPLTAGTSTATVYLGRRPCDAATLRRRAHPVRSGRG